MLIKIGKTKWLNANDISFLNIDYNDRKQVYVVRIWVNDRYYDYYGEEAAMKELMGMMTEAAQQYCEETKKAAEKHEVLN